MEPVSRRKLASRAGILAASLAAGSALTLRAGEVTEASRRKIIVTGGHPGDPEYGCGGTIARYTDDGHEVVLLYLNNGERPGIAGNARGIRTAEAKKACEILKARPLFAGQV